jgi:hypothetical protein
MVMNYPKSGKSPLRRVLAGRVGDPKKLRHNRNPFRPVIRKSCVSRFSLDGGFTMPVPLTSPAQSRRRWPLGRIAVVFALAGAVTAFTGTTALAAPATAQSNPDQITSVNVPQSVSENGIVGGDSMTVTIHFNVPTPVATTVDLKNFKPAVASFPAEIVVPAGNTTATFTVTTSPVPAPTTDSIVANDAKTSADETGVQFTVEPGLGVPGLTAAAPAAASVAGSTSVAESTTDGCSATVSNITQETLNGEAVVTFTGQVECNSSATQIYLHTNIFTCGSIQPEESHVFLLANCGNKTNAETYTPEESGVAYTISDETAAVNGYYASVLSFSINGTASGPIYGTPVHCSNGSCTNVTYAS